MQGNMSQVRSDVQDKGIGKQDIIRSVSHTGVPARFLAQRVTNHMSPARPGLVRGPRLARSLSQGTNNSFSVGSIGMHHPPSSSVQFSGKTAREVTPVLSQIPVTPDHDHDSNTLMYPPQRKSSLRKHDLKLGIDTSKISPRGQYMEIAMEVAEEIARLCHAHEPIPTDVPLSAAGMTPRVAGKMERWLNERFDFQRSAEQLTSESVTAESLAIDILASSPSASPERPWCTGEIPIMLDMALGEMLFHEVMSNTHSTGLDSPGYQYADDAKVSATLYPPILVSPPPPSVTIRPLVITKSKSTGRALGSSDGRAGRKAGLAVGLLAVGALLGSPSRSRMETSVPETPSPPSAALSAHFGFSHLPDSPFDYFDWGAPLTGGAIGADSSHVRL